MPNRSVPFPLAVELPPYQKTSSYSPEQSIDGPKLSPAAPASRSWGNGSYDEKGRGVKVGQSGRNAQIPSAGRHTTGSPGQSSRPGRW